MPNMNRADFLRALNEWCAGRYSPLVGFPDKKGFQNVAYLYDENYEDLIENSRQIMDSVQRLIGTPVVVLSFPLSMAKDAYPLKTWLSINKE